MADRAYAWVPVDALRTLVEYADQQRSAADLELVCSDAERDESDAEFRAVVDALGVDELTH